MAIGYVVDTQQLGRPRSGRSEKNIQELEEGYALCQEKSIRRAAVELDIIRSSIQRMLRRNIKAFPYKLQTAHKLEEDIMTAGQKCVKRCSITTKTTYPCLTTFGSATRLFIICLEE